MRPLPAPGRLALWIATSLAVAASAGCVSVGHDARKPSPAHSAGHHGAGTEPDGGTGAVAGPSGDWRGDDGVYGSARPPKGAKGGQDEGASARPHPSGGPSPDSRPGGGLPGTADPAPPGELPAPSVAPWWHRPHRPHRPHQDPSTEPSQPADPDPGPGPGTDPDPGPPAEPPSASPAADVRTGALAGVGGPGLRREPSASPQVGPV